MVSTQKTEKELRLEIIAYSISGMSLRKMEDIYGVSIGTLSRISRGDFPKTRELRERLGLPIVVPTEVCPECKIVHSRVCQPSFAKRLKNHPEGKEILFFYRLIKTREP